MCKNSEITPLVSVVLPAYNRAGTILRSIKSVLSQTYYNIELIVVDDASDDDTEGVVVSVNDSRVRYIKNTNRKGAGGARNVGIAVSSGSYLAFQDSDDVWVPEKLEKQVHILNSHAEVGVVFSPYIRVDSSGKIMVPAKVTSWMSGNILPAILGQSFIGTPTLLLRREVFDTASAFNEKLRTLEEWELCIRLAKHEYFLCMDEPMVVAYVTEGSVSGDRGVEAHEAARILDMHDECYRRYPRSYSKRLAFVANCYACIGEVEVARKYYIKAAKYDWRNKMVWFGFCLTCLGAWGYVKVANFLLSARTAYRRNALVRSNLSLGH